MKTSFSLLLVAIMIVTMTSFAPAFGGKVKHIVVFKFKPSATPPQITEVTKAFKELKGKVPGIISFENGVNNSPENLNKGFTHIYLLTFENVAARNAYLTHPDHVKFTELLGKLDVLQEPFVVDFETAE